ncbi:MAG TPA: glycosyltransferase [Candidatus Deferrimicrobiaceae bacterium]|jgi:spore maturation protein CgeB
MNILVVGKYYAEGFALHIAETLSRMGHAVRRFEPGYRAHRLGAGLGRRVDQVGEAVHGATDNVPAIRARRMRALWQAVDEGPLDAVIVCGDPLWPGEVRELRRRAGAPVAMWFPDAMVNLRRAFFMTAPYDAAFFKEPYLVRVLDGVVTPPVFYLPECFNPAAYELAETDGEAGNFQCDIATAGTQHSWRVSVFRHLAGYDVRIWGGKPPLWMDPNPVAEMYRGRPVFGREKARVFRGAKIVLNSLHYGEVWGLNARLFEVAGIGAFQMVDWRPGLGQLFEDGRELVSFRGIPDLKRKIDWWLPRDEERRAVAEAGMRRAHAEHTYRHRLKLLLATLAGKERGFPMPSIGEPAA